MIRIIPFEGKGGRVETGATQIGDDWPGLFIRGDDCISLRQILKRYLDMDKEDTFEQNMSSGFVGMIIDIIENDTLVKG